MLALALWTTDHSKTSAKLGHTCKQNSMGAKKVFLGILFLFFASFITASIVTNTYDAVIYVPIEFYFCFS